MDREKLDQLSQLYCSAEELSKTLFNGGYGRFRGQEKDRDWVWIAVVCLWERWFPDRPNLEMIDDRMQEGYRALEKDGAAAACRSWLDAWRSILAVMANQQIHDLPEFDERFGTTQSLFNWVQDFEMELHNAGLKEPRFLEERVKFCQAVLERSAGGELERRFKQVLAESYLQLGRPEGEQLFQTLLEQEPRHGFGWIGWADCYWFGSQGKDAARAEQILKRGLEVPDVEDREYLLERLHDLYEETGRKNEAQAVRRQIEELNQPKVTTRVTQTDRTLQVKHTFDFGEEGLPLEEFGQFAESLRQGSLPVERTERAGRNDPCPCGSGKKFKRCCGR